MAFSDNYCYGTAVDSPASFESMRTKDEIGKIVFTVSKEKSTVTIQKHLVRVFKRELGNFMDHLHLQYPDTKHLNFTHVFFTPGKEWIGINVSGLEKSKEEFQKKHDSPNSVTKCLNTYFRDRRIREQCGLEKDSGLDFTFYILNKQISPTPR
ncbi:uncharacterized protein LOC128234038 [Mya arenaria]|nr:uncharacterized protein LOC128234038 [Mya arenaria]